MNKLAKSFVALGVVAGAAIGMYKPCAAPTRAVQKSASSTPSSVLPNK